MGNQLVELQEDLMEYFKDMDDKTFVEVVNIIVYQLGTSDSNMSKLAEKFLEDNGLGEAYLNYILEMKRPSQFFSRHPSDIKMIEDVNVSLLSLSFIRLKRGLSKSTSISKPKQTYSTPLVTKLNKSEKDDLISILSGCERHNNDLLDDEATTRSMFDKKEADEMVAERNRFAKLFTKVLKILK